jgi:polyisoprenoid-binding protein YceI
MVADMTHTTDTAPVPTTATDVLPLVPGRWALDKNHSAVGFSVRHLGISKVRGRFDAFDVEFVVGATPADTHVEATIDIRSVDTGNADRDAHLQADDFFDSAVWPTMTFRSTAITGAGDEWQLTGDLTIRDVTRPVTFDVELHGVADFVDGTRHAGFTATTKVRRSEHGIATGAPLLGEQVEVELDLQFVEPSAS